MVLAVIIVLFWGWFTSQLPEPLPVRNRGGTQLAPSGTSIPAQGTGVQASRPFTYGNAIYSITDISTVTEVKAGRTSLTSTGSFVVLLLTINNQGDEPIILHPSDFILHDMQNRRFTVNVAATSIAESANRRSGLFNEAVQPGMGRQGVLVFEVPRDDRGFSLRLANGFLDVNLGR